MDFAGWLRSELEQRGWRPAQLARVSGVTSAQISRILSREQDAGPQACRAIAAAFEMPAYDVFIRAGILPPESERSPMIERIVHMLQELPSADQEELLQLARLKAERARREKQKKPASA